MKTIATIDFDILFWEDLYVYNDLVEPGEEVTDLIQRHPLLENIRIDYYMYDQLTRFIIQTCKRIGKKKIHFIDGHEEICNFIKEPSIVYNIDHHHDICYENFDEKIIKPHCGNWVKYLKIIKNIKICLDK